mgnify:CR=1 FL=1
MGTISHIAVYICTRMMTATLLFRITTMLLLLAVGNILYAQNRLAPPPEATMPAADTEEKKEVEILNADFLKFQEVNGKKYTKLVGNVALKQDGVLMWCDSANLDKETNSLDAWGRVHIQQDTVHAYANTLKYESGKKFAQLIGNARLTDGNMVLYTDVLYYDVQNKRSYYLTGGKILKDSTVITSQKGYYYNTEQNAYFQENVKIDDPKYTLTSDTLRYNINTKLSTFYDSTTILNSDGSRIYCNTGWYDSQKDISAFGRNTIIVNSPQWVQADSLYYEKYRNFGKAICNFHWIDSSMGVEILGDYAEFNDKEESIMATQHPIMIYKMDKDSLFMNSDTLKSEHRTPGDTIRVFYAYHKVRMFMKEMQAVADSMYYSFADSTFRMYYSPVVWNSSTQISGDTIYLRTKDKKADLLSIYKSGFIISPSSTKYYDQIKGTDIFGYFADNQLVRMNVIGNAESIYFGKDDEKNKYIGNNKALSTNITIYFKDKKINRIAFIQKPEAVFTPMKMLTEDKLKLKDFNWQIERKPKSREELFR